MQHYELLEARFGEWMGEPYTVACSSGTAALHLALEAMQLPLGSEVLLPEFTMVACARAITLAGLVPVPVDCGDDLLLDPALLSEHITTKTAAVMPVHIYGRRCDMQRITAFAARNRLAVVEDWAELCGFVPGEPNKSEARCFSFYANKVINSQEGGIICFREPRHASLSRCLRCQGFTEQHDFYHVPRGINARMPNCCAALAIDSLARVDTNLARRRSIERIYDSRIPTEYHQPPRLAPWVYDLRVRGLRAAAQDELIRTLNRQGIAARHAFKPISQLAEYLGAFTQLRAHRLSQEVVYLPLDPAISDDRAVEIADTFVATLEQARKAP